MERLIVERLVMEWLYLERVQLERFLLERLFLELIPTRRRLAMGHSGSRPLWPMAFSLVRRHVRGCDLVAYRTGRLVPYTTTALSL